MQKKKDKNTEDKIFASLEFDFFRVQLKLAFRIRPFFFTPATSANQRALFNQSASDCFNVTFIINTQTLGLSSHTLAWFLTSDRRKRLNWLNRIERMYPILRTLLWSSIPIKLEISCRLTLFCLFVLFHLYPPVTRKRRWRYILDESAPA